MQASQDIDWPLIQTLYTSGLGPKEISKQTGVKPDTIASRASRFRWRELMAKAKPMVQVTKPDDSEDKPALDSQSQRARKALGDVIARSAEKLASTDIKSAKHAVIVNQEAESMVRNAKTVFGWSEGQTQPVVRIGVLSQTIIESGVDTNQGQVIDVTPVKEIEPGQLEGDKSAT